MKQQEINNRKEAIAKFMNLAPLYEDGSGFVHGEWGYRKTSELEYNTSWDWLMPVVEKIEKGRNYIDIRKKEILLTVIDRPTQLYEVRESKIEAVFLAASDFCLNQVK
jgi:hypothetical protein